MDFRRPKTVLLSLLIVIVTSLGLLTAFVLLSGSGSIGTYGLNKTIGWAFELSDMATVVAMLSVLLFMFGYVFLWILKMRLHRKVSIVNLCLLLMLPVVWAFERVNFEYLLTFFTAVGVMVLLLANTVFAIRHKMVNRQKISL